MGYYIIKIFVASLIPKKSQCNVMCIEIFLDFFLVFNNFIYDTVFFCFFCI